MARILLVEDEDNISMLYRQELERHGHEVVCVGDGKAAVGIVQGQQLDLVIMDINLPEHMDGIEAMSRILSHDSSIPVIINTGYSEYQDNFMSWAADAYVLKSGDLEPLLDAVQEVLSKREAFEQQAGDGD
jgi:CheY-like chemotaxis protein